MILFRIVLIEKTYIINIRQSNISLRQFSYSGNDQTGFHPLLIKQADSLHCHVATLTPPFHTREQYVDGITFLIDHRIRNEIMIVNICSKFNHITSLRIIAIIPYHRFGRPARRAQINRCPMNTFTLTSFSVFNRPVCKFFLPIITNHKPVSRVCVENHRNIFGQIKNQACNTRNEKIVTTTKQLLIDATGTEFAIKLAIINLKIFVP